jgi:hypothetical protein
MQSLTEDHGLPTVKAALRFAKIRLLSHPEAAPLEGGITSARDAVLKAEDAHEEAYEAWLAATAIVRYLDEKLGTLISRVSRDAFNLVDGNRKDPRYQKLFATPPSEGMLGIATDPQERYVRTIIDTIQKHDDVKALGAHVPGIVAALGELKTAVDQRDELRLQEGIALRDLRIRLDAAKRAYNLLYPRLQLTFPDDNALVETFFRRLNDVRAEEKPVQPEPTEPAGPTER